MTDNIQGHGKSRRPPWRIIGWSFAALVLLVPWIAQAPWTLSDFIVMGVLLGGAGLLLELLARASGRLAYRGGALAAVAAGFGLIWVNGAVGFLGSEANPANLIFAGVLAVAAIGSALARLKAAGMARAMAATAAAQVLAGVIGLSAGWASPGNEGLYEVAMGTSLFAALWLISAGLFHWDARRA